MCWYMLEADEERVKREKTGACHPMPSNLGALGESMCGMCGLRRPVGLLAR